MPEGWTIKAQSFTRSLLRLSYGQDLKAFCKILHFYCPLWVSPIIRGALEHINSNYAIYFNKKEKRTGHLWQGRFYSRYITGDDYYYTLVRYIEQNPIDAGIVEQTGEYPYTLGSVIANKNTPVPCALKSKLIEELSYENIQDMIGIQLDDEALKMLDEIDKQKVIIKGGKKKPAHSKELEEHFKDTHTRAERDSTVRSAVEDGYTQAEVAKYLKMSRSNVCKIVKSVY